MSVTYIPAELRRFVVARADGIYEYCLIAEVDTFYGCVAEASLRSRSDQTGESRSARTASSVSFAAVTPIRSKHSATMLFGVVNKVINKSIGLT